MSRRYTVNVYRNVLPTVDYSKPRTWKICVRVGKQRRSISAKLAIDDKLRRIWYALPGGFSRRTVRTIPGGCSFVYAAGLMLYVHDYEEED